MKPADLEEKIKEAKRQGKTPFFVNITAGTTVYGAFDPINEIADICRKYNLWMHVDVCTVTTPRSLFAPLPGTDLLEDLPFSW